MSDGYPFFVGPFPSVTHDPIVWGNVHICDVCGAFVMLNLRDKHYATHPGGRPERGQP